MKLGIVTTEKLINYGSHLQAYALRYTCSKLGYDAYVLDIRNPQFCPLAFSWATALQDTSYLRKMKRLFTHLLYYIFHFIPQIKKEYHLRTRAHKFLTFQKKYIRFSSKHASTRLASIQKKFSDYDIFITGSDNVWNIKQPPNPIYFLEFVNKKNAKKISYAPSFGSDDFIQTPFENKFKLALQTFDFISCREKEGTEFVQHLTSRTDIPTVTDPTLLLEKSEWENILISPSLPQKEYILLYNLQENPILYQKAKKLSNQLNLPLIEMLSPEFMPDLNIGPREFLGLIQNANVILTNSYHGMLFSIIFRKNFHVVSPFPGKTRFLTVLKRLSLEERMISLESDWNIIDFSSPLNYTEPEKKLNAWRHDSLQFLQKALGGNNYEFN